jgi:proton-translocating NADH-quinone oxidoreductase chain M
MILSAIFLTLILSLFILFIIPNNDLKTVRSFSLLISGVVLVLSTYILSEFDFNISYYQNVEILNLGFDFLNINFYFGLDGLSVYFFFLTALLIFICVLFSWESDKLKENVFNLLLLELLLLLVFSVLDLLLFYVFFEAILIPMFFLVGFLGSRARKIRAAFLLFFYTLFGSLLMLIGLIYIYSQVGSLNIEYIATFNFTDFEQKCLWLAFFLSFASKIPMFPFHIWLPEAHVEAPTIGSVLLAGILLKLGVYGFLRYSLTLFPEASLYFSPLVYLLSIIGIIYASFTAIRQTDIKRIIAYSSIAHMNLVTIGIFSFTIAGIEGSLLQSISHGFVSGGMFLMVGILYERYHSRLLYYYGGLVHVMPLYSTYLLIFTMANIALPGTSSFVGEFLLFCGIFKTSSFVCIISAFGVVLCGAYSLWLYNRIIFGNLKIAYTKNFKDLNLREFSLLTILIIPVILMGINPSLFSSGIKVAASTLTVLIV